MRQKAHMRICKQPRMDVWLLLVDSKAGGTHFAGLQRHDERILIHNTTARGVHDDHAVLRLLEFLRRDNIACLALVPRVSALERLERFTRCIH